MTSHSSARVAPLLGLVLWCITGSASAQAVVTGTITTDDGTASGSIMVPIAPPGYGAPVAVAPAPPACPPELVCQMGPDGRLHGYRTVTRHHVNGGLLGGGIGMFAGAYVLNIFGTLLGTLAISVSSGGDPGSYLGWGFVPIVGPIAQMFYVGGNDWMIPILAVIEAVEVGGLIMAIFGQIGSEEEELEMVTGVDWRVMPYASPDGAGLGASLRF